MKAVYDGGGGSDVDRAGTYVVVLTAVRGGALDDLAQRPQADNVLEGLEPLWQAEVGYTLGPGVPGGTLRGELPALEGLNGGGQGSQTAKSAPASTDAVPGLLGPRVVR